LSNLVKAEMPSGDDKYLLFDKAQSVMDDGKKGPYHDYLFWACSVIGATTPELKRTTIVASMYGTFLKNEQEARIFWGNVAKGGDESTEDNEWKLSQWLESHRKATKVDGLDSVAFYEGCSRTWNATRAGRLIKEIKYSVDKKKGLTEPSE
jgi:hypothetical protein